MAPATVLPFKLPDSFSVSGADPESTSFRGGLSKGGNVIEFPPLETIDVTAFVQPADIASEFEALADEWHARTDHFSVTWRMVLDPAYLAMIGMSHAAVPYILRRIREEGASWLPALQAIARKNVAEGISDWNQCVGAWEQWARDKGYL